MLQYYFQKSNDTHTGETAGKKHCNYDCEAGENDTAMERNKGLERENIP
jgi:hypothetical protein